MTDWRKHIIILLETDGSSSDDSRFASVAIDMSPNEKLQKIGRRYVLLLGIVSK